MKHIIHVSEVSIDRAPEELHKVAGDTMWQAVLMTLRAGMLASITVSVSMTRTEQGIKFEIASEAKQ